MRNDGIQQAVAQSIAEDVGSGDITAALIGETVIADAEVISREPAVVCGIAWFNEVYRQIDETVTIQWQVKEGESVSPDQCLLTLGGKARSLVTGERCALNWLQFMSGTANQSIALCKGVSKHQDVIIRYAKNHS